MAACALADFKLLPGGMIGEFTSFYMDYKAKHRDVKLDLRNLGDRQVLPEDERGLSGFALKTALQEADAKRLAPLGSMLTEFFSKGDRLERSGFFNFQPQDCGNDASKARALGSLVTRNASAFAGLKTEQGKVDLLRSVFEIESKKIPEKGSIFSVWEDGIHRAFMDKARQVKPNENYFQYCSVDDLQYLEQHAPAGAAHVSGRLGLPRSTRGWTASARCIPNACSRAEGKTSPLPSATSAMLRSGQARPPAFLKA